jgi:N-ethylmaleimide reductase
MSHASSRPASLLSPAIVGRYTIPNRIVMAPMTRNRAGAGMVPTSLAATHYQQRASAGLIVTESTQISPQGVGYLNTPGIHSGEQVEGWRRVTAAVHARGGRIFLQLQHVGRVSHPDLQPGGALPVAPSAIAPEGFVHTAAGQVPFVTPRALEADELPGIVSEFADAARRAHAAGFDGVEVHGANGYLIDQFLRDGTNHRTDAYGGSIEKRARLLLEVTEAVARVWSADRVGVRLSPTNPFNDMSDSDPVRHFGDVARALDGLGLAYLHVASVPAALDPGSLDGAVVRELRDRFRGSLMINGGFDQQKGDEALAARVADLVSFGALFLANPDLPERFAEGAPLNAPDPSTFHVGGARGYTDYPARDEVASAS